MTIAQAIPILTEPFVRLGLHDNPEQALRHIILDYIERQIALAEAEVERYHDKHRHDFVGWSKSLSGRATIEDEDEWMEWEAVLDMLEGWRQIRLRSSRAVYDALLRILRASSVVHNPRIVELQTYGTSAFRVKVRAAVTPTHTFQLCLNYNPHHIRYAYQLFSHDHTVLRWDNAPHHPELTANYPHHFHAETGQLSPSTLRGDPFRDLPTVLATIEQ